MEELTTRLHLATVEEVPAVYKLLKGFAKNRGVEESFKLTEERLKHLVTNHGLNALLVYHNDKIVGTLTFYATISTFAGETGFHIEDMYIRNTYQRRGIGKLLLDGMIEETKRRGYAKLEWHCAKDNFEAMKFYEKMGAIKNDDWKTFAYYID